MNKQEIFDKVTVHLLTQKKKAQRVNNLSLFVSVNPESPICTYRSPEGLRCAIGCLIPDELYDPVIEGISLNIVTISEDTGTEQESGANKLLEILSIIGIERNNLKFLRDLQDVHDGSGVGDWKVILRCVANEYGCKTNILEQF